MAKPRIYRIYQILWTGLIFKACFFAWCFGTEPELLKIQVLCSFRAELPALLMRNFIAFIVLIVLAGPLAAQPAAPGPRRAVPAALDVAGLHLVLSEEAQRLVQQKADGLLRHQP